MADPCRSVQDSGEVSIRRHQATFPREAALLECGFSHSSPLSEAPCHWSMTGWASWRRSWRRERIDPAVSEVKSWRASPPMPVRGLRRTACVRGLPGAARWRHGSSSLGRGPSMAGRLARHRPAWLCTVDRVNLVLFPRLRSPGVWSLRAATRIGCPVPAQNGILGRFRGGSAPAALTSSLPGASPAIQVER
jgi:hypothetical protein